MSLNLGNTNIGKIYLGNTKIAEAYLGSSKVYELAKKPYLVFEFSVNDFVPTTNLLNSNYRSISTWTQVSSSPNRWKLELSKFGKVSLNSVLYYGLCFLFSDTYTSTAVNPGFLVPENLGNGTCKLIDSGNLDITDSDNVICESMDRMFSNCTGLTYITPLHCSNVQNVGGIFQGCTEVTEGALAQYTWFNTYGVNINNHSGTFTNCGSNTQTGTAELAQIPVGWGGTLVPASTLMTSAITTSQSAWQIATNYPTWTDVKNGMYLFTEASVSRFAGVSMNRSRIRGSQNGLGTSQASYALYFYPAFVQTNGPAPGGSSTTLTWLVTPNKPNGNLTVGQSNTDMPGTLDYGTYGAFAREYGTYDSTKDVYFVFLTTNVPIDQWSGFTDAYGFLYNGNYNSNAALRWFF
jgi:hypothetical protein